MEKLNSVQRYLYSFGYPRSFVKEFKTGTEHYREEVRDYVKEKVSSYKKDAPVKTF